MNDIISTKKRKKPNLEQLVVRCVNKIAQVCSKEAVSSLIESRDIDGRLSAGAVNASCLEVPGTRARIDELFDEIMNITGNHCISGDCVHSAVYNSVWDGIAGAGGSRGYVDVGGDDIGADIIGNYYADAICEQYEEFLD